MRKLFLLLLASVICNAQTPGEKLIIQELRKIRQLLEAPVEPTQTAQPTRAKVNVKGSPVIGDDNAPITIVEFTDFQCPFCNKFHTDTFPQIRDKLISLGKVRFVSMDLPLPATAHPNALQAAEAGQCAADQFQFWQMRDWMQSNPDKLDLDHLKAQALELKLDMEKFGRCLETGQHKAEVEAKEQAAIKLGITGTPSFVIGKSGDTVEGPLLVGNQPFDMFEKAVTDAGAKAPRP